MTVPQNVMLRGTSISSGIAHGEAFILSSVDQILVPKQLGAHRGEAIRQLRPG